MFCSKNLSPTGGKLRSSNGARVCTDCLEKCAALLKEDDLHCII